MPSLEQFRHLFWVARQSGGLHGLLTWKPFSLTAFRMLRALKHQGFEFGTIIDGGANIGQFARAAIEFYPEAEILSFEALPDVAETLRANLVDQPQVQVEACALGSHDGMLTFHRNAYSLASSALPAHENQQKAFSQLHEVETLEVPVQRLDTVLHKRALTPPVLLKLDLQGYELEALHGASETLSRTQYVLLELAFKPIYEGEPLFDDLYTFLRDAGFHLLRPIDILKDDTDEIVQMDALFCSAVHR